MAHVFQKRVRGTFNTAQPSPTRAKMMQTWAGHIDVLFNNK
jgi:hypothetical protein